MRHAPKIAPGMTTLTDHDRGETVWQLAGIYLTHMTMTETHAVSWDATS